MQQAARRRLLVFATVIAAILVFGGQRLAQAQAVYGSIFGQVTDASGAAVPNATVTITDQAKGTSVQVKTTQSGEYQVSHLIPDVYDVMVSGPGFKPAATKGIQVSADAAAKIDLSLSIGNASETVTVTEEAPQLKTDRADVAQIFDEKTVSELPIQGRNFANLEMLIPGAQVMGWSQNSAEDAQGSPTVQIAGQSFSGVDYELDGAANQDPILGQIVINPPLDAVTEAKITTQSYDAEFGQSVAAVVSSQTKSGTNSLHGDVFDYRRSDAQQARNPYNQYAPYSSTSSRLLPPAIYSQYGASLGGPIKKNKVFAFGDYQAVRQKLGSSALVTVPTKLAHDSCLSGTGCDFSEFLTARGAALGQIYNPRNIDPATGAVPFANNFIPDSLLSPQAKQLLALIPYPTVSGQTFSNYAGGGSGIVNQNSFDVRVDAQVSETKHAFARYSYFDNKNSASTIFGKAGGTGFSSQTNSFGGSADGRNQSAVTGMDIALGPNLLTDFRLGYLRYHVSTHKYDGAEAFATNLGMPGLNTSNPFTVGAPAFYPTNSSGGSGDGLSAFGSGLGVNACNCTLLETEDQYQLVNNWTKIIGPHSIKFGVDMRYGRNLRVPSDTNRTGELYFSASDTANATLNGGLGLATMMLGDVTSFGRYVSTSTNAKESQKRVFSYVQDSWRVTPSLTLDLGVRWEIYFPETVNGKGQGGFADLNTGTIRVAGYGQYNTAMNVQKNYKLIAPRLGISYQPDKKTVIRAGYGRSFDIGVFGSIFGHVVTQNLPVLASQSLNSNGTNSSVFNLANGPAAFNFPTIPSSGTITIPDGDNVRIRQDPNRFPTVDAWNLSLQRQLTAKTSLTVAYVGNKGSHTFAGDGQTTNNNEPFPCLPGNLSSTGQTLCWNPSPTGAGQTRNTNLLRPYYAKFGWTQSLNYYHDGFDTHYNALQVTAEHRYSQGLQLTGKYTWQRAFNYGGDFSEVDKKTNYGRFDDLREQQATVFGSYDLPFGRHQRYLSGIPKWADYAIGGYEISTSLNLSSGLPFTASYGECGSDLPAGPCRPDRGSGDLPLHLSSFNPNTHLRTLFNGGPAMTANGASSGAFARPAINKVGNSPRNGFVGPKFFDTDMTLMKNIPIHESVKAQFRVDAFNVFNYISAGNPGNTCIDCGTNSGVGTITGMAVGAFPRQLEFSATVSF